jgi:hypothetical protein
LLHRGGSLKIAEYMVVLVGGDIASASHVAVKAVFVRHGFVGDETEFELEVLRSRDEDWKKWGDIGTLSN